MNPNYLVAYTVFGIKYNGFRTSYRAFETKEEALNFINRKKATNNFEYILFKKMEVCEYETN